ncbi:MAG: ADP-glyceromanno-heptose 6-epimerase [Candidatus Omnitrophica bacterium]|nr:ADP-glyceromanno-heptose 6-epimerase [Candidatus Omnitrophota bacterium]
MKVLVTGGAGFIGSNVAKILEGRGDKVFILDNFSHSSYKNLLDLKADVICGDITDQSLYNKLPSVDAVVHEAAITDTTLLDDTMMMNVNYNGSKNVLNFCLNNNIPLVYASSAGVYGESKPPMREEEGLTPHNTYGYSKFLFDCHVKTIFKDPSSPRIVGLRYFNVYGPREYHKGLAASMTYQLYLQMISGKSPRVFKHGEQKRDFIYVKDVARITVEALVSSESAILNVGTGTPRSFNDIIAAINQALKTDLKPDYFDNPYGDKYQNFTQADTSLLSKILKTQAKFSLEEGISDYINFHLEKK